MKIKLIAPHEQRDDGSLSSEMFKLQRLCLPLLASYTPAGHEIKIVDESFCPDNPDDDVDLVGITVITELAAHAYRLAKAYRKRGVKVVMGGIHPTVLPQEALLHADSVVIGEGEEIWPTVVNDAASGRLQRVYHFGKPTVMQKLRQPLRNLYPVAARSGYAPMTYPVETARGCPYDCEFCSIGAISGQHYRARPVESVLAEIESFEFPNLFFVDDSLALNRIRAKKLFSAMTPLKRLWVGQGGVSLAEDIDLLKMMRSSGCRGLLIGFESVHLQARETMRKISDLKIDYMEAMKRFHGEGIAILGAFVFGFDGEDRDVFERTLEFCMKARIDVLEFRILTPLPGTRFYNKLLAEGRLLVPDWWLKGYTSKTILFRPKGMTIEELFDGFAYLNRQAYSYKAILKRFLGMGLLKRTGVGARLYAGVNLATRKRYLGNLEDPQPFVGSGVKRIEMPAANKVRESNC